MGNYEHSLLKIFLVYFKTSLLLVEHYDLFTIIKLSGKLQQCIHRFHNILSASVT